VVICKNSAYWNPPTFVANLPAPGVVIFEFKNISSATVDVVIKVNGKQVASHSFTGGPRDLSKTEGRVSAELPAGKVEIFVDITSGQRLSMGDIYVVWQMQDPTRMIAIEGRTHAEGGFLYLKNKTYDSFFQEVLGLKTATLQDLHVDVEGLKPGTYRMKQIIPETGEVVRYELVNSTESGVPLTMEVLNQSGILAFEADFENSVESISNRAGFLVYPNPFNDQLNIDLKKFSGNELNIELYSISGVKILSEIYKHPLGHGKHFSLDTGNLAKGTYILRIIQDRETIYSRVLVK